MKKWIAGFLAAAVCLGAAACGTEPTATTTEEPTPVVTTTADAATSDVTTTATEPVVTTTAAQTPEEDPDGFQISDDIEAVSVGKYVTLYYNGAAADVKYTVEKGVGSRETVKIEARMHEDYLFDGWSEGDAIVNGKVSAVSKELTYTVNATKAVKIWLNARMQIVYDTNGGEIVKNGFDGTDTFSVAFHHNPNTLPEKGYFAREGYTLTGYNTKADGTGEAVSLGSKAMGGKGKLTLYCVWEKNTDGAQFVTDGVGGGVAIKGYTGTDENVVIPSEINGKKVVKLAGSAFKGNATVKRVVIPSTVNTIEGKVFQDCTALETVVLFDTVKKIDDTAFTTCKSFKMLLINSVYDLVNEWTCSSAAKIDRLMWAKDKKKIVIIGGSGSLMGFDSAIIDEALGGEYEIINFGENANVTALVYFDIVEDFVQEGDIVLWCPEPGTYTLGYQQCSFRFWDFRKSNYDFTRYIDPSLYQNLYSSLASYNSGLPSKPFKRYDMLSNGMSKYGDDMGNRVTKGQVFSYNFNYQMLGEFEIMDFVENITDKGASVYYSFAAMQEGGEKIIEKDILALEKLVTSVPGIVSISDYKDCLYPNEYFYDSAWHMTNEGARARSEQVAKDLLEALGKS